jgi:hypothetical protein
VLASALAAPLPGCGASGDIVDYRYRFKVVVEVDGEEREGASVIRVRWRDRSGEAFNLDGGRFRITVWAEAPIVDLGPDRGLLFALLRKAEHDLLYPAYIFPRFAVDMGNKPSGERVAALRDLTALPQELNVPREEWPIFARFGDLAVPASVEEVTPRNFASIYGVGSSIKRLTMQITDEEPTRRIDEVLPWLADMTTNLAGERRQWVEGPLAERLVPFNFKMS